MAAVERTVCAAPRTRPASGLTIREARRDDHAAVQTCMLEVFRETAGRKAPTFSAELWSWQYVGGELGTVVVVAEESNQICGYYHALLLKLRRFGEPVTAAMVQDVGTLRSHRGRGVFREMGSHAVELLRERGVSLIYTFPNSRSLPSFVLNHRYQRVSRVPVYATPLDLAPWLSRRIPGGGVFGALGNGLVRLAGFGHVKRPDLGDGAKLMRLARFDESVEVLTEAWTDDQRLGLERSASYLNWRFFDKPNQAYEVWGLSGGGKLRAYVVTCATTLSGADCVLIADYGCRPGEEDWLARLTSARLAEERAAGKSLGLLMTLHALQPCFARLSFTRVPERFNPRPFNLLCKDLATEADPRLLEKDRWLITLADLDVF